MKPFKNMPVLITGGAGFLGAKIVENLLSQGANITVIDDLSTGTIENLPDSNTFTFIQGSVVDERLIDSVVKGKKIIFHLAARNMLSSIKEPKDDMKVNIGGTLNVLVAATKYKVEKVLYSSSSSVYGNQKELPMSEDAVPNLLSPYSISKLAGENYCATFRKNQGLHTVTLRYSNIYGPKQRLNKPYSGVILKFFEYVMNNTPPFIHGNGEQTRDFTYIDDAVEATLLAAISPEAEGEIFNVGTGLETSINTLAIMIIDLFRLNLKSEYINPREIDNIKRRAVAIEKIRKRLNWSPKVKLEDGLERTKRWLQDSTGEKR